MGTFLVSLGFTKFLAISMPGVLTNWRNEADVYKRQQIQLTAKYSHVNKQLLKLLCAVISAFSCFLRFKCLLFYSLKPLLAVFLMAVFLLDGLYFSFLISLIKRGRTTLRYS